MQFSGRTELFWPRQLVRKWLQFKPTGDDFRADHPQLDHPQLEPDPSPLEDEDDGSEKEKVSQVPDFLSTIVSSGGQGPVRPILRGQSETLRKQYVDTKEYRIAVNTWNVAGRPPSSQLDLDEWLDTSEEADIYVLGFQEIVPLNAGNVLCVEDEGPAAKWETLIRDALNRTRSDGSKNSTSSFGSQSQSAPQSPNSGSARAASLRARDMDDIDRIIEGVASEDAICSLVESKLPGSCSADQPQGSEGDALRISPPYSLKQSPEMPFTEEDSARYPSHHSWGDSRGSASSSAGGTGKWSSTEEKEFGNSSRSSPANSRRRTSTEKELSRSLSHSLSGSSPGKSLLAFGGGRRSSVEGRVISDGGRLSTARKEQQREEILGRRRSVDEASLRLLADEGEANLYNWSLTESHFGEESMRTPMLCTPLPSKEADSSPNQRTPLSRFSRVASKQMVGLFLTVWIRSDLRRHVHNVKVSCVGCGLMGYLGNKGSISVSMSLHQTSLCFICSHLTSGDKEGDEHRRNSDVAEILRRTTFTRSSKSLHLPETIMSHDCKIWLGDLNYRLALPDNDARHLVAQETWDVLLEADQLKLEQNAARVFDGWQEGAIRFAPTYKYTLNSDRHAEQRTPAWCDRVLWRGWALRQTRYSRSESRFSDHRPVSASFVAEVERVSRHKLKRTVGFATSIPAISAEDISPHLSSIGGFSRQPPIGEMKQLTVPDRRLKPPLPPTDLKIPSKHKLKKEISLPLSCFKVGDEVEGRENLLWVF